MQQRGRRQFPPGSRLRDPRLPRDRFVQRIVRLVLAAQAARHPLSLSVLAREHGVCERTIRRDMESIEMILPVKWRKYEAA